MNHDEIKKRVAEIKHKYIPPDYAHVDGMDLLWLLDTLESVLREYKLAEERAAKLETAVTILLESAECRGDGDCDHCVATQLLDEYNQLRGGA